MAKRMITQQELSILEGLEREIAKKRRELKTILESHERFEAPVMAALLDKSGVLEEGPLTVSVDWSRRRSPNYKLWIDQHHGEGTSEKILDATPPTETPFLVIEKKEVLG